MGGAQCHINYFLHTHTDTLQKHCVESEWFERERKNSKVSLSRVPIALIRFLHPLLLEKIQFMNWSLTFPTLFTLNARSTAILHHIKGILRRSVPKVILRNWRTTWGCVTCTSAPLCYYYSWSLVRWLFAIPQHRV